jgi:mRNA interferase HicA
MKRRDLIKFLEQHNCALIREGGSHSWWGNAQLNTRSAVPRHTEINEELVKKI